MEIRPRVEIYAVTRRDWRYRHIAEDGATTESGPLRGVRGHAGSVFRDANEAFPGVPILVLSEVDG